MNIVSDMNKTSIKYEENISIDSDNVDVIPQKIIKESLLEKIKTSSKGSSFNITDLNDAKQILRMPRNGPNVISQELNITQDVKDSFLRIFSAVIGAYILKQFPGCTNFSITNEDFIFTCTQEKNKSLHTFFSRNFFNSTCYNALGEKASILAAEIKERGINKESLDLYSERGVIELLKDLNGNDLISAMREEGYSEETSFLMVTIAVIANKQISMVIDAALSQCKKNRVLRHSIRDELREHQKTMPLWQAASESLALQSLIYEVLRVERPLDVQRKTRSEAEVKINLSTPDMPFDSDRFASYTSKFAPGLPHLPFGSGPNMCPGWKLAMVQITQMLALVLYDDSDSFDSHSAFCSIQ